nr:MAG TPA: hypothetical protein [Crassvirales sp.]DAP79165.1 MAG TPA: hypothetical protein [Caudoviricetes sp.]DAQ45782.1 MAG TPA: hypothetical protein [Caudoviricetes sp.]DAV84182.1 MAG TPA: hypothetical protein [Caudoviricetes sp.]
MRLLAILLYVTVLLLYRTDYLRLMLQKRLGYQ